MSKTKIKLSKFVYSSLRDNTSINNNGIRLVWNNDLRMNKSEKQFTKEFRRIDRLTMSTKLRYFQYRINIKALTLNIHVARWDSSVSENCTFCNQAKEMAIHLFIECEHVKKLWKALKRWVSYFNDTKLVISNENIIFSNYEGKDAKFTNTITLITKFYIYRVKVNKVKPNFVDLIREINKTKEIEQYIATRQDKLYNFARKWKDFTVFQ